MTVQLDELRAGVLPASCPYLGVHEDAATHCTFATSTHRCYRSAKPSSVTLDHQLRFCLSGEYSSCPVFSGAATPGRRAPAWAGWLVGGTLALALVAVTAGRVWQWRDGDSPNARRPAPDTPAAAAGTAPASIPTAAATIVSTTTIAAAAGVPAFSTQPPAALPEATGPVRYRVRPGDTLTGIALFFGARQEDIITLNGLPRDGRVLAGQDLIIPRP